jgi:hypothetical protein
VHVRSWKIDFTNGNQPVVDYVNITANDVYPGMTNFVNTISAFNYSEVLAEARFTILEANIMGDEYTTVEGRQEAGQSVNSTDLTSDQLKTKLSSDYPFSISFTLSTQSMQAETGAATFTTSIVWPYESGDDAADTYWGSRAYSYMQTHPAGPCIRIRVKIYITQANS